VMEVLTAVLLNIRVIRDVTQCCAIRKSQNSRIGRVTGCGLEGRDLIPRGFFVC
jgi:hypothetical protein